MAFPPRAPEETTYRGAVVVLLHALCSSSLEVRLFGRALRDRGYHVVIPIVAGYSEGAGADAPFERWIESVTSEVMRLQDEHEDVHLCGVSLGATLALAVAANRLPAIKALSLISTTLFYDGWNVSAWRFLLPLACYTPLGYFYSYRESAPFGVKNERVREWIAGQMKRGELCAGAPARIPVSRLREADRLIRYVKRTLQHVDVPLLLIHARDDDVAGLANPRYVASHVGSTIVRETIVEHSYHLITLDNDRELAALRTVQFFNQAATVVTSPDALQRAEG